MNQSLPSTNIFRHIFCMIIFVFHSGCFYWQGIDQIESNSPPQITHSDPESGGYMILNSEQNTAFVVVTDANDPESLRFQWWISGEGILGYAEPIPSNESGFIGSKLTIGKESHWDGRKLNCIVYDSFNSTDTISWTIVIPQEAQ